MDDFLRYFEFNRIDAMFYVGHVNSEFAVGPRAKCERVHVHVPDDHNPQARHLPLIMKC